MGKGVGIGVIFFVLGYALASSAALSPESRLALSDEQVESVSQIPFESIKVYPSDVRINYPGLRYARVKSNSMAPLITDTSTVLERAPSSQDDIHVGDVISFYEPSVDDVVLHLVTRIEKTQGKNTYRTKGLANENEDAWLVPYDNVKGILVGIVK